MARDQGYVVRYFQEHRKSITNPAYAYIVLARLTRMNFTCRRELEGKKKKKDPGI